MEFKYQIGNEIIFHDFLTDRKLKILDIVITEKGGYYHTITIDSIREEFHQKDFLEYNSDRL